MLFTSECGKIEKEVAQMRKISVEKLNEKLEHRKSGERLNLREVALSGADSVSYTHLERSADDCTKAWM